MPLTHAEIEVIRSNAFAEDVPITDTMRSWPREKLEAFFEGGGKTQAAEASPPPADLPAAPPPTTALPPEAPKRSMFRVAHAFVNVRDAPSLKGKVLTKKAEGQVVEVEARGGPDLAWLRLKQRFEGDHAGWLLVNGAMAGVPKKELLVHASGPLPPEDTDDARSTGASSSSQSSAQRPAQTPTPAGLVLFAAPMAYEVVHPFVRVRRAPSATAAELCMMKRRGTVVSVSARDGDWVQLESEPRLLQPTGSDGAAEEGAGGWMLTNGMTMTPPLGELMKPHVVPVAEGTRWVMTRSGTCTGYSSPAGSAFGEPATKLSHCTEGDAVDVLAECGLWAQVAGPSSTRHWVEMDAFLAG